VAVGPNYSRRLDPGSWTAHDLDGARRCGATLNYCSITFSIRVLFSIPLSLSPSLVERFLVLATNWVRPCRRASHHQIYRSKWPWTESQLRIFLASTKMLHRASAKGHRWCIHLDGPYYARLLLPLPGESFTVVYVLDLMSVSRGSSRYFSYCPDVATCGLIYLDAT